MSQQNKNVEANTQLVRYNRLPVKITNVRQLDKERKQQPQFQLAWKRAQRQRKILIDFIFDLPISAPFIYEAAPFECPRFPAKPQNMNIITAMLFLLEQRSLPYEFMQNGVFLDILYELQRIPINAELLSDALSNVGIDCLMRWNRLLMKLDFPRNIIVSGDYPVQIFCT